MTTILVGIAVLAVISIGYARWMTHERRKANERRFEQRMKAHLGPINYPPARGAKGGEWRNRRTI